MSLPEVVCWESEFCWGDGLGLWILIAGVSCSRREAAGPGLLSWGGGDRKRGETGHRGLSLRSEVIGFWGVGAWICGSCGVGGSTGVVVEDRLLDDGVRPGAMERICWRVGLWSC